ncbi:hypothetical protein O181_001455 [Austropuccinia psidii MF-1]|uniref:Uncharacterized protein n=1 Tax=Austropuccinia psidii MF-1 TaxID=1389203 RepID=A0A9Q3GBU8_9BASI|nr:hypothetical protein [Austropuccinia psidii MF-1]
MNLIGTIIREIIIPHRKGNKRLDPELIVCGDSHIQVLLLGTDYQRMYGVEIYNSKHRNITMGTNKERKLSLDINQLSHQDPSEELLNKFKEGKLSSNLTSIQKISLLKTLRKKRPAFSTGE